MLEIRLLVRVAHILAAATWVGGSIFYQVVVIPALRNSKPGPEIAAQIGSLFRKLVSICVWVLLLSGAFLTFDRLTQTTLGLPYLVVLVFKILAALIMFLLVMYLGQNTIRRLAKRPSRLSKLAPRLILALGILVLILGALLNSIFEATIAPH